MEINQMNEKNLKCYFCGKKIDFIDYWGDADGHIFCDSPCMIRSRMGNNDKCSNCGKKIFGSVLEAKNKETGILFYFCYEKCFNKYNKRINNKLERINSVIGGYWA